MRHYKGKRHFNWIKTLLIFALLGIITFSTLFGIMIYGNRDDITGDPQVMIVLGARVMPDGQPSVILQDRLNEAHDYWAENPEMTVVVAGGQGADEPTTEAFAMSRYLVEKGIPAEQIIQEGESHNTDQNIRFSIALLDDMGYDTTEDMMVVSSGLHLSRASMLWGRAVGTTDNLSVLAAPMSHQPSRIRMYIREPLALMKSFLIDR